MQLEDVEKIYTLVRFSLCDDDDVDYDVYLRK
jgi:hypothetical protein